MRAHEIRIANDSVIDSPAERIERADDAATPRPARAKRGVLVVDDEHLVRVMVQLGLERDNFEVYLASGGREAIQLYREHRPSIDIVLLDVRMPGFDGPQTMDVLRALNPNVLICLMSGDTASYSVEDLRQRGATHFLAKPFRLDRLAKVLGLLIAGLPGDLFPGKEEFPPQIRDAAP